MHKLICVVLDESLCFEDTDGVLAESYTSRIGFIVLWDSTLESLMRYLKFRMLKLININKWKWYSFTQIRSRGGLRPTQATVWDATIRRASKKKVKCSWLLFYCIYLKLLKTPIYIYNIHVNIQRRYIIYISYFLSFCEIVK